MVLEMSAHTFKRTYLPGDHYDRTQLVIQLMKEWIWNINVDPLSMEIRTLTRGADVALASYSSCTPMSEKKYIFRKIMCYGPVLQWSSKEKMSILWSRNWTETSKLNMVDAVDYYLHDPYWPTQWHTSLITWIRLECPVKRIKD